MCITIAAVRGDDLIDHVGGSGSRDHVCWAYDEHEDFTAVARQFLADGYMSGKRLMYCGPVGVDELRSHLDGLEDLIPTPCQDTVLVVPISGTYAGDDVVDAVRQREAFARATDEALAAGFTGLRVVADVSTLVRTPEQVDAFARWEHMIDRYMSTHQFSAICAFDRRLVSGETVAAMSCLHPSANTATMFRLYAVDEQRTALTGEVDAAVTDLLSTTLDRIDVEVHDGELVVDAHGLAFIDHRGLSALCEYADALGVTVVLRRPNQGAARLIEMLGMVSVRAEDVR
jgi:anti-anti-sigma regulatory factor